MAKRKWIFGSLCLTVGILLGHVVTRAGMWSARTKSFEPAGIPPATSGPQQPTPKDGDVHLTDAAFCHTISSFGNYVKYERDEFAPGQELLVYGEIGNFRSQQTPDGRFRTLLKSQLELFPDGDPEGSGERIELPETEDLCR